MRRNAPRRRLLRRRRESPGHEISGKDLAVCCGGRACRQGLKPLRFGLLVVAAEAATHKDHPRNNFLQEGSRIWRGHGIGRGGHGNAVPLHVTGGGVIGMGENCWKQRRENLTS